MRAALWPEAGEAEHLAELQALAGDSRFRGWLALAAGTPVGFAEACLRPFANGCESRPVVFLEGIWVAAAHRHGGVARALLGAVEGWARELGLGEIGSDADTANHASHAWHELSGFEEMERVVCYRKRLG